jgi:hypothetical protein
MQDRRAIGRLSGLALAGIVVAIFAVGLARGQDDWHAVLVLLGALLQVIAVVYVTKSIWLGPLLNLRTGRQLTLESETHEYPRTDDRVSGFSVSAEEALVAGGMAIAGILLTLAGNLLV